MLYTENGLTKLKVNICGVFQRCCIQPQTILAWIQKACTTKEFKASSTNMSGKVLSIYTNPEIKL